MATSSTRNSQFLYAFQARWIHASIERGTHHVSTKPLIAVRFCWPLGNPSVRCTFAACVWQLLKRTQPIGPLRWRSFPRQLGSDLACPTGHRYFWRLNDQRSVLGHLRLLVTSCVHTNEGAWLKTMQVVFLSLVMDLKYQHLPTESVDFLLLVE